MKWRCIYEGTNRDNPPCPRLFFLFSFLNAMLIFTFTFIIANIILWMSINRCLGQNKPYKMDIVFFRNDSNLVIFILFSAPASSNGTLLLYGYILSLYRFCCRHDAKLVFCICSKSCARYAIISIAIGLCESRETRQNCDTTNTFMYHIEHSM